MLAGVRGGWIIDHRFTLGVAGHGLVTQVTNPDYEWNIPGYPFWAPSEAQLFLGYGGLLLEPILAYRSPVHIALPVIIGAGGCGYFGSGSYSSDDYIDISESQGFFVLEPGVEMELNVIRLVRLGLGASYRYTSDLDLQATSPTALQGWNGVFTIKVGSF